MGRGEVVAAIGFALFGAFWVILALRLPYMGEFAPGSGFLPLWLGVTLTVLSLSLLFRVWRARQSDGFVAGPTDLRKPAAIAIGLFICIGATPWLGFLISVGLYLVALIRWVERRSWGQAVAVGAGTPIVLVVMFRTWLGVPLPRGPLGF